MIAQLLLASLASLPIPVSGHVESWPGQAEGIALAQASSVERSSASATPNLTKQFVAIVRERTGRHHIRWGDRVVTLWEICPERDDKRAVRRNRLGYSDWNATPLLGSPELLRWQVPKSDHGSEQRILQVDYSNFRFRQLLAVDQLDAAEQWGNRLYFTTLHESKILDVRTGVVTLQDATMEVLVARGADWLVRLDGVLARFDAASAKVVRRYPEIEPGGKPAFGSKLIWDGGRFAIQLDSFFDETGDEVHALGFLETEILYRNLRVWNLDLGAEYKVRVRIQARGGSGIGVIPIEVHLRSEKGQLHYTDRFPATGEHAFLAEFDDQRDTEWVTLDLESGKEIGREAFRSELLSDSAKQASASNIPEYLRAGIAQSPIRTWGIEQDLAYAFLAHNEVTLELQSEGVCKLDSVCRTKNGNELLVLNRGVFYLCNLETQKLKTWPAPPELDMRDGIGLYALDQ